MLGNLTLFYDNYYIVNNKSKIILVTAGGDGSMISILMKAKDMGANL